MTDCDICKKPLEPDRPRPVRHIDRDGDGLVLCRVCAGAARYAVDPGLDTRPSGLEGRMENWAYGTLWSAVWDPGDLTVAEVDAARRWLDRMGRADADPAAQWLPYGRWGTREEFVRSAAPVLLRRFGLKESDLDRLMDAYLEWSGDGLVPATRDAREMERRLRDA